MINSWIWKLYYRSKLHLKKYVWPITDTFIFNQLLRIIKPWATIVFYFIRTVRYRSLFLYFKIRYSLIPTSTVPVLVLLNQ